MMIIFPGCRPAPDQAREAREKIPVILDTDANNEIDDQHAIAYLLSNRDLFRVEAITVNATRNGGPVEKHVEEANRIVTLMACDTVVPVISGANGSFEEIVPTMDYWDFDGAQAVNYIIRAAKRHAGDTLTVIAIGKLTNLALALKKDPSISKNIRLVWLGSNYPEPGEYNMENDIPAMQYLLNSTIHFEMVLVRYGKPSGTDAVRITKEEVLQNMPGLGPRISGRVTGRHGGTFDHFGDYSVSLFQHIDYYGNPPSRALFDVCAVAVVKNPGWADSRVIPCPRFTGGQWQDQQENIRKIILWENFKKEDILKDMFESLKQQTPEP